MPPTRTVSSGTAPAVSVRPTRSDVGARGVAVATRCALAVVLVLAVAVGLAWVQDRDGHPGRRTDRRSAAGPEVLAPTNSEVDLFDVPGPPRQVGPWRWQSTDGDPWSVADGVLRAPSSGGTLSIDPAGPSVVLQVDVFRPEADAGLVFRWRDRANHMAIVASPDLTAWLLVQVVDGQRRELGRHATPTHGSTIGASIDGARVVMLVNGQAQVSVASEVLADSTSVGLSAPSDETRFDAFAALVP